MKRKILIVVLAIVCVVCFALGVSACTASGGAESTLVMEEGYVYITDFSVNYTSESESPDGDINESEMTTSKFASPQKCYIVMDFNILLVTDNKDNSESVTVKFTINNASVADCRVDYAETSTTSAVTSDNVTVLTATYTLPEKANTVKSERVVVSVTPNGTGEADISYDFICKTKTPYVVSQCDGYVSVNQYTIILQNKDMLVYGLNSTADSYTVIRAGSVIGTQITIKSELNGLPVTAIAEGAFYNCISLKDITMPGSITSIGRYAFINCTALTSIVLPDSLISIGYGAFAHCTSLTNVTIQNGIKYIDLFAFSECNSLNYYEYENGYYLGNEDNNCVVLIDVIDKSVKSFNINENTKVIYYGSLNSVSAFVDCTSLTSITIPDGVTYIGGWAFHGCTSLTSITIPDSMAYIGEWVFEECSSLTYYKYENGYYLGNDDNHYVVLVGVIDTSVESFTINKKTKTIGTDAFSGCDSLKSITIPESVTSIGECAFANCTSLTSITIPNSVTFIGDGAFCGCSRLTSVTIPDSVTSIGYLAFSFCTSLKSITIPSSVTYICVCAFSSCTSLKSITIPSSVTYISESAFFCCTSLKSVTFESTYRWYVTPCEDGTSSGTVFNVTSASENASYLKDNIDYCLYRK